jgi:hypothetical protein
MQGDPVPIAVEEEYDDSLDVKSQDVIPA